jgi:chromosome segregation and condensation protein ScpB
MADDATFRAQYLSKVETDLKRITLDQTRLLTQIEELRQQWAELEHDRGALMEVQRTLSGQPARPQGGAEGVAAAGERLTLRDLVEAHLCSLREPVAAAEVAGVLAREHPDRSVQIAVVRNTLEGLVAKGLAVRSKDRRLVFYRAVAPGQDGSGRAE